MIFGINLDLLFALLVWVGLLSFIFAVGAYFADRHSRRDYENKRRRDIEDDYFD